MARYVDEWEKYEDAQNLGFMVLDLTAESMISMSRCSSQIKCVASSRSKDAEIWGKVLSTVNEFLEWSVSQQRNVYEDNMLAVHGVAVAPFMLSLATKHKAKESTSFLTHIIKADWVHTDGLEYLSHALNNVGIVLLKTNRLQEATEAFKVSCEAAWTCVLHLCKKFASSDLSEDVIANFVTQTCERSAFLLSQLNKRSSKEIDEILKQYLGSWSNAQSLFAKIPIPEALVIKWVHIKYKQQKEAGHKVHTIYSLVSSLKVPMEALDCLLEQELKAYKDLETNVSNPELCKTMQTTISKIRVEKINIRKYRFQKSRILIAKGMDARACGVKLLNDCIKHLSEAISILSELNTKSKDDRGPICYLLAEAYCLRALCAQESTPNSKDLLRDIGNALKLWSSQDCSEDVFRNAVKLLYYATDLISLKGYRVDYSLYMKR